MNIFLLVLLMTSFSDNPLIYFLCIDNDDNELIDEMVNFLKSNVNTTNVFLLSFNGEQDRIDLSLQQMIRYIKT